MFFFWAFVLEFPLFVGCWAALHLVTIPGFCNEVVKAVVSGSAYFGHHTFSTPFYWTLHDVYKRRFPFLECSQQKIIPLLLGGFRCTKTSFGKTTYQGCKDFVTSLRISDISSCFGWSHLTVKRSRHPKMLGKFGPSISSKTSRELNSWDLLGELDTYNPNEGPSVGRFQKPPKNGGQSQVPGIESFWLWSLVTSDPSWRIRLSSCCGLASMTLHFGWQLLCFAWIRKCLAFFGWNVGLEEFRFRVKFVLLLMEEIPNNHLGCIKPCT